MSVEDSANRDDYAVDTAYDEAHYTDTQEAPRGNTLTAGSETELISHLINLSGGDTIELTASFTI